MVELAQGKAMLLPVFTGLLAVAIFGVDSFTDLDIAVAVLYVAVVLLSASFCGPRGVVAVTFGCIAMTVLSCAITYTAAKRVGLINTAISVLAVGITGYLTVKFESIRNRANALVQAEQLREALIGSVSHELRTPLASILGGVSILAETPAVRNDDRLAALARGIRDEGDRLNNDIQNLLDAARINAGGLHAANDWSDATDIIHAAANRFCRQHPARTITLRLDGNLPLIKVDPVLVEQALGQIIANAAKFSPPQSDIAVSARIEGQNLVIAVHDHGAGLNAEEARGFGTRFFRGERHAGRIPGSGLGSWIANTFVTGNGGTLTAASAGENRGTVVRMVFPVPIPDETMAAAD